MRRADPDTICNVGSFGKQGSSPPALAVFLLNFKQPFPLATNQGKHHCIPMNHTPRTQTNKQPQNTRINKIPKLPQGQIPVLQYCKYCKQPQKHLPIVGSLSRNKKNCCGESPFVKRKSTIEKHDNPHSNTCLCVGVRRSDPQHSRKPQSAQPRLSPVVRNDVGIQVNCLRARNMRHQNWGAAGLLLFSLLVSLHNMTRGSPLGNNFTSEDAKLLARAFISPSTSSGA